MLNDDFDADGDNGSDSATPYTYTGHPFDLETRLYQYRNRFYHAELGRFVSRDPIGYSGNWRITDATTVSGLRLVAIAIGPLLFAGCDVPLSVRGTVTEASNGKPISEAIVTLHTSSDTELWSRRTNDSGKFERHATGTTGEYCLSVEKTGYRKFDERFNNDGEVRTFHVRLVRFKGSK